MSSPPLQSVPSRSSPSPPLSPHSLTMPTMLFFLLLLFHAQPITAAEDSKSLLAFKLKADPTNKLNFTGTTNSCSWPGVTCTSTRVTRLVLEKLDLTGIFAPSTLSFLDELRVLSLSSNSLTGPIPADISSLRNLKSLFLRNNLFSGPFPLPLLSLLRLRTLNLSHNSLSGPLPSSLPLSLPRIVSLRLDSNRFTSPLPPLNQSILAFLNISSNSLSGSVPITQTLSSFPASSFSHNPDLCGEIVRRECRSRYRFFRGLAPSPAVAHGRQQGLFVAEKPDSRSRNFHRKAVMVIGLLAVGFLVCGLVGVLAIVKRSRRFKHGTMLSPAKDHDTGGNAVEEIESSNKELVAAAAVSAEKVKRMGKSGSLVFCAGEVQVYSHEQLFRASAEMLGRGNVGSTYKAVLDSRLIVGGEED